MKKSTLLYMTCIGLIAEVTQGTQLDSFESPTYNAGNSIDGVNDWSVVNKLANQDGIVAVKESAFSGGSQSVRYQDTDASTSQLKLEHTVSFAGNSATIGFDYRSDGNAYQVPVLRVYDSVGTLGILMNFMTSSGTFRNSSGGWTTLASGLTTGTWYRVEINIADITAAVDTFDLTVTEEGGAVGGIINATGLGFQGNIVDIGKIQFGINNTPIATGSDIYFDNVTITPSEKGSLAEDFESPVHTVSNSVHGVNGWSAFNVKTNQNAKVDATESAFSSGSQSVRYFDEDDATDQLKLQHSVLLAGNSATIGFDYRVDNGASQTPVLRVYDSTGTLGILINFLSSTGDFRNSSGGWTTLASGLTAGTWYRVEINIADITAAVDTFDLTVTEEGGAVGGIINATGLGFQGNLVDVDLIQFGLNNNPATASSGADIYFDNLTVAGAAGYDAWAGGWGVFIGSKTNDYDNDGLLNVYEYGLGGDPTDAFDQGTAPVFTMVNDGGSNVFNYVYPQLSDPDSGIAYHLELNTDLVFGKWMNSGYTVTGTNIVVGALDFVSNVTTTVESQKFIRLIIE